MEKKAKNTAETQVTEAPDNAQAPEATPPEAQEGDRETTPPTPSKEKLDKLLRYHVWSAIGVGLVPLPLVDLAALTGVQVNLIRKLANAYGIPFLQDTVKNILSSLVGSTLPVIVAPGVAASVAKFIPIFGQTAGVVTMPIIGGAATYAVGKVFIQHFASGGTFLTFKPEKVKEYYQEMFTEGKKVAADLKKEKDEEDAEKE
jgi:uncharacterized protein (DUF697 family)